MAKIGEYTRFYKGWQFALDDVSDEAYHLWPHLLNNPWSNASGLYEVVLPRLVNLARLTLSETEEALQELAQRGFIEWDCEVHCVFVINYMRYNWDSLTESQYQVKALLKQIATLSHLSLYPRLLEAYPELAKGLPPPGFMPSQRLRNGQASGALCFEQQDAPAPPDTPKVTEAEQKYLALRDRVKPALVAIYDECAAIMQEHSRQPRKAGDWRGRADDLRAIRAVAEKTKGIVEHLVGAFDAAFVRRLEEMLYYVDGKGRIEVIKSIATEWRDGTLKAAAFVNCYLGCRESYEASEKERADELNLLKAEYRELQNAPGVTDAELEAARARIAELEGRADA